MKVTPKQQRVIINEHLAMVNCSSTPALVATLTWLQLNLAIRYMSEPTDLRSMCDGWGGGGGGQRTLAQPRF